MMDFTVLKTRFLSQNNLDSPIVTIGSILGFLIIIYAYIFDPFISWYNQKQGHLDQLVIKTEKILAMQKVEEAWLKKSGEFDAHVENIRKSIIESKSKAVNQRKLQEILKKMLSSNHLTMDQVIFLDVEPEKFVDVASIRFRAKGTLLDHLRFLDALAGSSQMLVLQTWQINSVMVNPMSAMQVDGFFFPARGKQ